MSRQNINQLKDGDTVNEVYLLVDKQLRANRNASLFLSADLRDASGVVNARMWNVVEDRMLHFQSGNYVQVKGKVHLFQGALQIILTYIEPVSAENLDPAEFQPQASHDVQALLARLREMLLGIENNEVRTLMECFLVDESLMEEFCRAPAGVKTHHAYHGGLIEHVVNLMETAHRIADLYPKADMSLLLAGVFLHDIGKVRELGYENEFIYTDEGQLLGHLIIGVEMLTEKIRAYQEMTGESFPKEAELRLKHMIVSHHGTYEFGSPRLPMTPEAVALHHLDNLDAKVNEFARFIDDDLNSTSSWTPYSPRLQRKLFKGMTED
ncbi:3'-5' exoribonuclease YhaM family protein [Gimesia chilikensis]|uniref:3'-5' exoribonuclease YhaM n=1 Tax=Gimesia chilikensis TaxID=2605989 RepID=A0A517PJC2_9PLAN|nr:HD domain-containing protein [Gimesia chilikensis]QDT19472.1 3'-5' exoribonuclease YhaM [Gimesia chilikensis]